MWEATLELLLLDLLSVLHAADGIGVYKLLMA
jgi:hypothetical protein